MVLSYNTSQQGYNIADGALTKIYTHLTTPLARLPAIKPCMTSLVGNNVKASTAKWNIYEHMDMLTFVMPKREYSVRIR